MHKSELIPKGPLIWLRLIDDFTWTATSSSSVHPTEDSSIPVHTSSCCIYPIPQDHHQWSLHSRMNRLPLNAHQQSMENIKRLLNIDDNAYKLLLEKLEIIRTGSRPYRWFKTTGMESSIWGACPKECGDLHIVSTSSFGLMPAQKNTFRETLHASSPDLKNALRHDNSCMSIPSDYNPVCANCLHKVGVHHASHLWPLRLSPYFPSQNILLPCLLGYLHSNLLCKTL